jgi:hypothetical protein
MPDGRFDKAYYKDKGCSRRLPDLGAFHHFQKLFRPISEPNLEDVPLVRDEYSTFVEQHLNGDYSVTVNPFLHGEKSFKFNRIPAIDNPPIPRYDYNF